MELYTKVQGEKAVGRNRFPIEPNEIRRKKDEFFLEYHFFPIWNY